MTTNLKKVFTLTSFNLSSVFYARFCAGSFYQEFDECRTFLLYKNAQRKIEHIFDFLSADYGINIKGRKIII